ncbi:claudin-7-A-like [Clavelina lepadiformis]|uniref:Claudin n=1 Tax=Clavelina lepadiformis TaxID=159417 RepID=A0ABP0FMX6_CLALP
MGLRLIEAINFVLLLVGFLMLILCVFLPYWRVRDQEQTVVDQIIYHDGIWLRCITYTAGNWQCDDYERYLFNLKASLNAARGLSLVAMFGSFAGLISALVGCSCNKTNANVKKWFKLMAGGWSIGSGICLVVGVSVYAHDIINNYFLNSDQYGRPTGTRYVFGSSLFVGWVSGAVLLISGAIYVCLGCGKVSESERYPRSFAYRPSQPATIAKEYV